MDQLEKLNTLKTAVQTRTYMHRLARGIDPISGKELDKRDTSDSECLSRCLEYASEALQAEIENEVFQRTCGMWQKKILESGVLKGISYSEQPLSIQELFEKWKISNEKFIIRRLKKGYVCWQMPVEKWLEHENLVRKEPMPSNDGKYQYFPTQRGAMVGLSVKKEMDESGSWHTEILCGEAAQHLIAADLNKIVAYYRLEKSVKYDMLDAWMSVSKKDIRYSEKPLMITEFAENIFGIEFLQVTGISERTVASMILEWLSHKGALEEAQKKRKDEQGVRRYQGDRWPTKWGQKLGIRPVNVRSNAHPSWRIKYNEDAQRFIVENMEQIVAYRREKLLVL